MELQPDLAALQAEITRTFAAALASDAQHIAEMQRRDELHLAETDRRDRLHHDEILRRSSLHEHEIENIRAALESRDVIGQAKGILMATLGCSPDGAYDLLRKQSQHENRKLVEVATEIAARPARVSRSAP